MIALAIALLSVTLLFVLILGVLARPLLSDFASSPEESSQSHSIQPAAAVILCLRGADPTLPKCIIGLLRQEYSDFEIHLVLDSATDPAAEVVDDLLDRIGYGTASRVVRHVLDDPELGRGLKVSAILQALDCLDDSREIVAFLDADTAPHPSWLSDLSKPLRDRNIGATSGMRWFRPSTNNPGSLVRREWNLFAVTLMRYFRIPWGGSMAIRRDALQQSLVSERWSRTLCEDTCLGDAMSAAGFQIRLVPAVSMVNDESVTLPESIRFITRQLVFTRLHSANWLPILIFGLCVSCLPLTNIAFGLWSLYCGNHVAALICGLAAAGFQVGVTLFELRVNALPEKAQASVHSRPALSGIPWMMIARLYLAQVVCVFATGMAFVMASLTRQVIWRGITYKITAASHVRLVKYTPFDARAEPVAKLEKVSL